MKILLAVPFFLFCGCTFNVNPPLSYDSQITLADMTLQRFAPEECAYNPRAIKYVCEDDQAEVLNDDLIIIRQKLITYAGMPVEEQGPDFMIEELFKCRHTPAGLSCGAKLPREIVTGAELNYKGRENKLHLYARK